MLWVMCFPSLCSVVSLVFLFGPCNANRCSGAPKGKCHILFFHDLIYIFLKIHNCSHPLFSSMWWCSSTSCDSMEKQIIHSPCHSWHNVNAEIVQLSALSCRGLWKSWNSCSHLNMMITLGFPVFLFIVHDLIGLLITPLLVADNKRQFKGFWECLIEPFKMYKAATVHCEHTKCVV